MLQHPPLQNLGENVGRLQRMVESTKVAEREVNTIVQLSMSNNRCFPIGGASPNLGAPAGRVFSRTPSETDERSH